MAASDTLKATDRGQVRERAAEYLVNRHRFRATETLPWLIAIAVYFIFPDRLTFGSQVLVMVMFALSLDLILGYAGVYSSFLLHAERAAERFHVSTKDILVRATGPNEWTYQIGADQLADTGSDDKLRAELLQRIQAISGSVQIDRYREEKDASGRVTQYRVWAHR